MRQAIASFFLINSIFCSTFVDSIYDEDLSYFEDDADIDDLSDENITPPTNTTPTPSPIPAPPQSKPQAANPNTNGISSSQLAVSKPKKPSRPAHFYYTIFDKDHLIFLGINYLYWTVSEPGLHYALVKKNQISPDETPVSLTSGTGGGNPVTFPPVTYLAFGEVEKIGFSFSSGVRAEASYQFRHSPWNLSSEYSYFQTSKHDHIYRPDTSYGYLRGLNVFQYNTVIAQEASCSSFFNYQNARLLFGFSFNPLKQLIIDFRFGPQSTWIRQNLTANFVPYAAPQASLPGPSTCFNTFENKAWGIGLYGVMGVEGHLGKGFSLGLDAGISGMSGQTKYHHSVFSNYATAGTYEPNFDVYQKPEYQFMAQGMLKANIGYSYSFSSMAVRIDAAYEFNALINMLELYRIGDNSGFLYNTAYTNYQSTPIYLQGVNIKFGLAF